MSFQHFKEKELSELLLSTFQSFKLLSWNNGSCYILKEVNGTCINEFPWCCNSASNYLWKEDLDHENCKQISKSVVLNLISCIIVNIKRYWKKLKTKPNSLVFPLSNNFFFIFVYRADIFICHRWFHFPFCDLVGQSRKAEKEIILLLQPHHCSVGIHLIPISSCMDIVCLTLLLTL